jgi:hypothetical protein
MNITGPQNYGDGAVLQIGSTGSSSPEFAGDPPAGPVPEPSAVAMLLSAAGVLWWWQRRGRP